MLKMADYEYRVLEMKSIDEFCKYVVKNASELITDVQEKAKILDETICEIAQKLEDEDGCCSTLASMEDSGVRFLKADLTKNLKNKQLAKEYETGYKAAYENFKDVFDNFLARTKGLFKGGEKNGAKRAFKTLNP